MCRTRLSLIVALVLLAGPAAAQTPDLTGNVPLTLEPNWLAWSTAERHKADVASTALVFANIGLESWHTFRSADRGRAFGCQAFRMGVTITAAEVVKRTVHRTRPDGSDQMSFYSEHTALAMVNSGWRWQIGIPVALGAGYFRSAANRHFPSDVAVGALAGFFARKVCS